MGRKKDFSMNAEHAELASGRWAALSLLEQMANIGGEVERAFLWRSKNNAEYSKKAAERALELLDLSLAATRNFPRLKELSRTREALADYLFGTNEFKSDEAGWKKYFFHFTLASRKDR